MGSLGCEVSDELALLGGGLFFVGEEPGAGVCEWHVGGDE